MFLIFLIHPPPVIKLYFFIIEGQMKRCLCTRNRFLLDKLWVRHRKKTNTGPQEYFTEYHTVCDLLWTTACVYSTLICLSLSDMTIMWPSTVDLYISGKRNMDLMVFSMWNNTLVTNKKKVWQTLSSRPLGQDDVLGFLNWLYWLVIDS